MAFEAKRQFRRTLTRDGVRMMTKSGISYATYEDLSAGGLRLRADHQMTRGDVIQIDFSVDTVKGRKALKVMGRVIRNSETQNGAYDVGVEFVDLPDQFRGLLESLVDDSSGPF